MAKNGTVFRTAYDTYTVTGIIGEGGSGVVHAVTDAHGRPFALKVLSPRADTLKHKRFKNEIEFCRKNKHSNIITLHDVGFAENAEPPVPFYVMPRYSQTLRGLMQSPRTGEANMRLFAQMLDGLEAAHAVGVFHRDVKPENILVEPTNSQLVVADFGVAHFAEDLLVTAVETKLAERLGNFQYSAPEQRVRGALVDHRADIFALGLILNEMFTGVVPHGAKHRKIAEADANYAFLDDLVEQMMHQSPTQRPGSIDEIKKHLIARQQSFVVQQVLDRKREEVVPVTTPGEIEPISLRSVDWDQNQLTLKLNRVPEDGFVDRFRRPVGTMYTFGEFHPGSFKFIGDSAYVVRVTDSRVQGVVDLFKARLDVARTEFHEDLKRIALQENEARQTTLRAEQARAEQRAAVLRSVKF